MVGLNCLHCGPWDVRQYITLASTQVLYSNLSITLQPYNHTAYGLMTFENMLLNLLTRCYDILFLYGTNIMVLSKAFIATLCQHLPESLTPRGHSGVSARCRSLGTEELPIILQWFADEDGDRYLRALYGESSNTESRSSIIIFVTVILLSD